jgi:hypothetical protein
MGAGGGSLSVPNAVGDTERLFGLFQSVPWNCRSPGRLSLEGFLREVVLAVGICGLSGFWLQYSEGPGILRQSWLLCPD